jgi:hypothetical protein
MKFAFLSGWSEVGSSMLALWACTEQTKEERQEERLECADWGTDNPDVEFDGRPCCSTRFDPKEVAAFETGVEDGRQRMDAMQALQVKNN